MSPVNDTPAHGAGPADSGLAGAKGNPDAPVAAVPLTLADIRARLDGQSGRRYWRSLEELAETPEFTDFLHREFPRQASEMTDAVTRRDFLHVMAASLALAGLTSCSPRNPAEKIVPYVKAPEGLTAGKSLYYASTLVSGGYGTGVLVESVMGRPIKIEGNDRHPASLGATSAAMQASLLTMYDPDRSQTVTSLGEVRPWGAFITALGQAIAGPVAAQGEGLRILTETVTSPTLAAQIERIRAKFPMARWHQYEPLNDDSAVAGARMAFGEPLAVHYDLSHARVIVSLDADFLSEGPGHLRYVRQFSRARRVRSPGSGGHGAANGHGAATNGHGAADAAHGGAEATHGAGNASMARLYVAESTFTNTGGRADHRLAVDPDRIAALAAELARQVNVAGAPSGPSLTPKEAAWVRALAADLTRNQGASVVIAGPAQPAVVHALAHAINGAVGAFGATAIVTEPVVARPEVQAESLRELVTDMSQGKVQVLLIVGANPVYDAPADLPFARALEMVGFRAHWGLYDDETANLCHWHVPATHELEAWGDARAHDGTVSLIQPLIAPLYEGKTATEFLSVLLGESGKTAFDHVREHWQAARGGADFEAWWNTALHDGVIAGSEAPVRTVGPVSAAGWTLPTPGSGTYLALRPDPSVGDGRWANNGWLQELSKPITHLTWENVALLSPRMAESLRVSNGDIVELKSGATAVTIPAWILPGQPESVVTLHLGYGRTRAGRIGTGIGVSGYPLRSTAAPGHVSSVSLRKTGKKVKLACTQNHHSMEGRHLVRSNTLAAHMANSHWPHELGHHEPAADMTMYEGFKYPGNAWGLAVDLTSCTGCNACVVACQAENSIPVVGKEQVWRGREMAWLRIDRYFEGPIDEPQLHYQPIMCQQCENAPCEAVCPVSATVHNHEGLNDMAYNRCVGTRYCSNNCPYKVRRFNFLKYSDETTPQYKLMRNPEVTIRTRGVMEKCTYCVQRINAARIEARTQGRPLKDGDIVTACQQACPAEAIVFGDINDPTSLVAQMKSDPLNYGILTDLNTRPRTTYLAELRNPNPDLEGHS